MTFRFEEPSESETIQGRRDHFAQTQTISRHAARVPPQFTKEQWDSVVKALRLSPQQANIVGLIMQARRDKQIAGELGLSPATVRTHLRGIFVRLDVQDRVELVLRVFDTSSKSINQ